MVCRLYFYLSHKDPMTPAPVHALSRCIFLAGPDNQGSTPTGRKSSPGHSTLRQCSLHICLKFDKPWALLLLSAWVGDPFYLLDWKDRPNP